jgi:hypothetical protein
MAWISMVRRCKDRRTRHAKYYIGKGITVCEQWKDYERFLADMGEKPVGYRISLDRIDGNKGYEPSNCRWATTTEQSRNRANTTRIAYFGLNLPLGEWCDRLKLNYNVVRQRLTNHWNPVLAIIKPTAKARLIHYRGESKTLGAWCRILGLKKFRDRIKARIFRYGWTPERAFTCLVDARL